MIEDELFRGTPFNKPLISAGFDAGRGISTCDILMFEDDGSVVVRLESYFGSSGVRRRMLENQKILRQLRDTHGIAVPQFQNVIGEAGGRIYFFTVVERVQGRDLSSVASHLSLQDKEELLPKVDQFFSGFGSYIEDMYHTGGWYNNGIFRPWQYIYGTTRSDPEKKIYLVDIEPNLVYVPLERGSLLLRSLDPLFETIIQCEAGFGHEMTGSRKKLCEFLDSIRKSDSHADIDKYLAILDSA